MPYTSFNQKIFNATEQPLFLGETVNIARYDEQRYPMLERLIEKQLSFFWRPEEVDLTRDRIDFQKMSEHQQHIFLSNLKYQTLLDSVQGRSPNMAFLPIVSLPEAETWFETWAFSETIHSRSYTHIIRNVVNNPGDVFDHILDIPEILQRASSVTRYYDDLIAACNRYHSGKEWTNADHLDMLEKIYLCLFTANMLEGIRFYVSFACTFAFAEQKLMEGNAKIVKLIARDEALHMSGTQLMINWILTGQESEEFKRVALACHDKAMAIANNVANEEKAWAEYLFSKGSMLGLNTKILSQYVDYLMTMRLNAIGYAYENPLRSNPLPWINSWLTNDSVQVAPQESEISSYLVGQINANVGEDAFEGFEL